MLANCKRISLPIALLFSIFSALQVKANNFDFYNYQRQQPISGRVIDSAGNSLSGVSVQIKGTRKGDITNEYGYYRVNAEIGDVLVISMTGYAVQEVSVTTAEMPDIRLQSQVSILNDVVVVGYGTQQRANLTGAIATVDVSKDLTGKSFTDIGKGLQGNVPGLQVTYGDGAITAGASIQIRGMVSVNGSSAPLILVDGVALLNNDLTLINPNDIASISVLKDASSTSIFGARAAAGVILITTKSGSKNTKSHITYSDNFSWSKPTYLPSFPDPVKEIQAELVGLLRTGGSYDMFGAKSDALIAGITNWKQNYAGKETGNNMVQGQDFDIINGALNFYRVWNPIQIMFQTMPSENHNINFSGGNDRISYYVSGSYSFNEGVLKPNPDKLYQYNIMAGITADVTNWLTLSTKMSDRQYNYNYPFNFMGGGNGNAYYNLMTYMYRWGANQPYGTYTDPGTGQTYYFNNPNAALALANTCTYRTNTPNVNVTATIKFTPWLNLHSEFGYIYQGALRHQTAGSTPAWDQWLQNGLVLSNSPFSHFTSASLDQTDFTSAYTTQLTSNTYLTFNKKYGLHNVKVVAGVNAEKEDYTQLYEEAHGLLDPTIGEIALTTNTPQPLLTNTYYAPQHTHWSVAGYFARINYNYNGKYLLELSGRYDGSSNFPVNNRWAFFPSGSAGWNITDEKFAKGIKKIINNWKIRGSYGTIGNQDIVPTGTPSLFQPIMTNANSSWLVGSGASATQAIYTGMPQVVPASLTWERISTLDFGTDMRFLHNDLGLIFDWFQRNNKGMVTPSSAVPATFGANVAKTNMGNMRTRGFELSLDYHHQFSNGFAVYANVALSNYIQKISYWPGNPTLSLNAQQFYTGETVGEIWGFKTLGYFKDDNDVTNSPTQKLLQSGSFKFGPGDIKYADLDGNDTISGGAMTLANHGDLMKIGNTTPQYQYSFRIGGSYKGFDIDIYFQGVGKRQLWATGNLAIPEYTGNGIFMANQLDYWTPDNPNAYWPAPSMLGSSSSTISNQNWWTGSSFFTPGSSGNNFYPQTKYLLNLAYLRLKTLEIGYTLPATITERAKIEKLRLYVQGMNIFTIKHNNLPIDPELATNTLGGSYWYGAVMPFNKSYSFGIQLTF